MKKHERGHGIRKIWRPSNNLRDRPRDWCANRYVEIYFCFLIRCCVRGVVGSFHSWRGRVIFRAIKVKATVSRSDRSINFCSTLFILSFSLSFSLLFFPIWTILLLIRFFIATRECLFRSIETSESSWFVQNRSTCRALTLFFFFFFFYSVYAIFYNKQRRSDIRLDLCRGKIAGSFNLWSRKNVLKKRERPIFRIDSVKRWRIMETRERV